MAEADGVSAIGKVGRVIKREFMEMLPAVLFFLVGFNLIALTLHLALQQRGIPYDGLAKATVGALVVGKVVLVVDKLPLGEIAGRPLFWQILRRSTIYTAFAMLAHFLEAVIHHWIERGALDAGFEAALAAFVWQRFVVVLLWVFVLFFVFIAFDETRREYGLPRFAAMLFGKRRG